MAIFCNRCGQDNLEGSQFCNKCGQLLGASPMAGPIGGTSPLNQGTAPGTSVSPHPQATTDGKAVASLILGILSLFIFSIFAGIPAVILGHVSRSNIKKSLGKLKGEGIALAGLILGYVSFLAIPFILIIAAIAIPNLLRARISANEASAVRAMRDINQAAYRYQERDEKRGYPSDLQQFAAGETSDESISQEVASGSKAGYKFQYTPTDSDGDSVIEGYFVAATPATPGSTGVRSFCSDQTGVIRVAERNETCTLETPPI